MAVRPIPAMAACAELAATRRSSTRLFSDYIGPGPHGAGQLALGKASRERLEHAVEFFEARELGSRRGHLFPLSVARPAARCQESTPPPAGVPGLVFSRIGWPRPPKKNGPPACRGFYGHSPT